MKRLVHVLMWVGTFAILRRLGQYQATNRSLVPYSMLVNTRWLIAYGTLCLVVAYATGLPDYQETFLSSVFAAGLGNVAAAALFALVSTFVGPWLLPRFVVISAPVFLTPFYVACAALARRSWNRRAQRERVLVVASAADYAKLVSEGDNRSERPFVLVGQVSPLELPDESGLPIATRVKETNATLIVLSEEAQMQGSIIDQVDPLHTQGVRVRSLTRFYDFWLGKLPVSELTRMHLFFDISDVHRSVYQRIKRAIDALVGLVGTFTFFLVAPLVAFVNLFGNRGPLLFSQVRVGQAGKAITIYKFRSMKPTATSVGEWTSENDPRITRIGRYLRLTHFDEIPQFLNILKGDISLVGPRPEQPHYVDELASKIPHYELRHSIRPGLTGWAQVKYPYGSTDADAIEKLEYELHYLAHQNPRTDASIVWRTARSILTNPSR